MTSWVAALVRVIAQKSCGAARSVIGDIVQSPLVARLPLERGPVDRAPSSRGGVPVLSRASGRPSAQLVRQRRRARSPTRPPARLAHRRNGACRRGRCRSQDHRARSRVRGRRRGRRRSPAVLDQRSAAASPSTILEPLLASSSALDRRLVELAVGLDARAAHRRALAGVEHADSGSRPRRPPGAISPSKASTSRTRWPLPSPPIAGLHDIAPIWSRAKLTSATRAPIRAAAARPRSRHGRRRHDDVEIGSTGLLFPDAEFSEQGIEHVLDSGAAGDPVEPLWLAQPLGDEQQSSVSCRKCASACRRPAWRCRRIERDFVPIARQQRGASISSVAASASRPSPVTAEIREPWAWAESPRSHLERTKIVSDGRAPSRVAEPQDEVRFIETRARPAPRRSIASTSSASLRRPAVSISRKGIPPIAVGASIRSRVVPGTAEVMAASLPC
jgi:hypothetical protein